MKDVWSEKMVCIFCCCQYHFIGEYGTSRVCWYKVGMKGVQGRHLALEGKAIVTAKSRRQNFAKRSYYEILIERSVGKKFQFTK